MKKARTMPISILLTQSGSEVARKALSARRSLPGGFLKSMKLAMDRERWSGGFAEAVAPTLELVSYHDDHE